MESKFTNFFKFISIFRKTILNIILILVKNPQNTPFSVAVKLSRFSKRFLLSFHLKWRQFLRTFLDFGCFKVFSHQITCAASLFLINIACQKSYYFAFYLIMESKTANFSPFYPILPLII